VDEKPIVIARADGSIEELAQLAVSPIRPRTDYFASAEYRREMSSVLVRRVLSNLTH
jgi:CO/xanthine dehydrogenase FAD-binding subunit